MIPNRSIIGATSPAVIFEVERGAIRRFVEGIGDPNPVYQSGDIAPPTFPTTFRIDIPGVTPDPTWLHGSEEYTYERPLYLGDRLACVWRVTDFYEEVGRSGRLSFLVTELEGRDLDGGLAVRGREITVVGREIRGTGGDRDMIAKTLGLGEAIPSLVKDPIDKAQLLRYAGGSGDYALVHTDVETARAAGLGDVIAHGMLSMGFLGQLVVRWAGAENIRRIQTRFAVIVRLGEVLTCRGVVRSVTPIEDGRRSLVTLEIWAENQKGETVTYGEAEVYSDLER